MLRETPGPAQASATDIQLAGDRQDDLASSQQGELLYSVLQSPQAQGSVAIGWVSGTNRREQTYCSGGWLPDAPSAHGGDGNASFEKPYSIGRDAVDLITTVARIEWRGAPRVCTPSRR